MKNLILIILGVVVVGGGILVFNKYTSVPKNTQSSVEMNTPVELNSSVPLKESTLENHPAPAPVSSTSQGNCRVALSKDDVRTLVGSTQGDIKITTENDPYGGCASGFTVNGIKGGVGFTNPGLAIASQSISASCAIQGYKTVSGVGERACVVDGQPTLPFITLVFQKKNYLLSITCTKCTQAAVVKYAQELVDSKL